MSNIRSQSVRNNRPMQKRSSPKKQGTWKKGNGNGAIHSGNASSARSKYIDKAKEALSFGDRVSAENFFQHAEHYTRILIIAEERLFNKNDDDKK